MMNGYTRTFAEIRKHDINEVGGKGANLGDLAGKGFPVPPGFVVSAMAYKAFFESLEPDEAIQRLERAPSEALEAHCAAIRDSINTTGLPTELSEAILAAHQRLVETGNSGLLCAVRSSATAEDLGDASFAGQHATYYYVKQNTLLTMVKNCWASLWNHEAVSYRATQGIDHASVYMAVVVQEMIRSEISGITFTANPVSGTREEIVTESSWGMGAAIVDGRVTPDRYIVARESGQVREHRIAEKRFMVPAHLKPGATGRLEEVSHEMRQQETLSPDLLHTVVEWAIKAEEHFGSPQDVEWAIADGRFYMLQSRPITVMGREEIGKDVKGQYVICKPLVENFTDPLTPFTADVWTKAVPGLENIQGWPYIDLNLIRSVFPFKMPDHDFADLLYSLSVPDSTVMKFSLPRLPAMLLLFFSLYCVLGPVYSRTRYMPDDFMDSFRDLCHTLEDDASLGLTKVISRLLFSSGLLQPIGNMPLLVNVTASRYMGFMRILSACVRRWTPKVCDDAVSLLCSGSEGVLSTEMGRGIWALAREARRCEPVRDLLLKHKPQNVLPELRRTPAAQTFLEHFTRFLAKNGHRGLKELELKSIRWEEEPAPVLGMIRNYLLVDADLLDHEKKAEQARADLEAEIRRTLEQYPLERTLRLRWRLIRYLAKQTKYFAKIRENSRFYHTRAGYALRKKMLRLETEFLRQGRLKCKDDIFFMSWQDILKMEAGQLGWSDVEDGIRENRLKYVRLSKMSPPKTIGITFPEKHTESFDEEDGAALRGQTASSGEYEGKAHVILDPSIDAELHPGEILVAPYTDPAWTPLFLTAGAAVVEVGSYLSHAGTIAREYGMPCVVDVTDCTTRIQTGDRIRVDGERGIVRLLSAPRQAEPSFRSGITH